MLNFRAKTVNTIRSLFQSDLFAGAVLVSALALMSWQGV